MVSLGSARGTPPESGGGGRSVAERRCGVPPIATPARAGPTAPRSRSSGLTPARVNPRIALPRLANPGVKRAPRICRGRPQGVYSDAHAASIGIDKARNAITPCPYFVSSAQLGRTANGRKSTATDSGVPPSALERGRVSQAAGEQGRQRESPPERHETASFRVAHHRMNTSA